MTDTYKNYEELKYNELIGYTYRIEAHLQSPVYAVIAPHGGGIEVGTSELARAVAKDEHTLYLFEGLKPSDNATLHITSTNFDEPIARMIMPEHEYGVSLHGMKGDDPLTLVGGSNRTMVTEMVYSLNEWGFSVQVAEVHLNAPFAGTDPANIVNIASHGGVQLEISTAQRKAFFEGGDWSRANRGNTTQAFVDYVKAIREILY